MERLFEAGGLPSHPLPPRLRELCGGDLGFPSHCLYANFVTSLDGVVSLGEDLPPSAISLNQQADRFMMGLLRAFAGAVLVGAGTLRSEPKHRWIPEATWKEGREDFAELRRSLGHPPHPRLAVVTRTGRLDLGAPAFEEGALIITGREGARALRGSLPGSFTLEELPALDGAGIVGAIRAEGHQLILTEGGPQLMGSLLSGGQIDQLFLTLSPVVAGRSGERPGLGLVEGAAPSPGQLSKAALLSLSRSGSHLFLRYSLGG